MSKDAGEREGYSAIILVIVLIAVAAYILFYGLQTLIYVEVRSWGTRDASLYVTPSTLNVTATKPASTTHLEFYGFQCEAPWKGPAKTTETPDYVESKFPSGPIVRVESPEEQADALQSFKGESPEQQQHIANVFGAHPFDSNFDLFRAVYSASPSQVSAFLPRVDAERVSTLLDWKMSLDSQLPGGTFVFDLGRIRGLQFGDPDHSEAVILRAFTEHDRQFKILLTHLDASNFKVTQADINQIILTLKPVPLPGESR